MNFYICDLTGRHYSFLASEESIVLDVKRFMAVNFGLLEDVSRVILIYQGQKLTEDSLKLSSLGLTSATASSFRMHSLIKFKAPEYLFDGQPHPFQINDISIGGPAIREDLSYSLESFLKEMNLEEDLETLLHNHVDVQHQIVVNNIESKYQITLPQPLIQFLSYPNISKLCQKLALNPLVITDYSMDWGAPIYLKLAEQNRHAFLFMMDHQGCCYWYCIWNENNVNPNEISCEVYVLFGGQEFELGSTVYLTSRSLWLFLTDYAYKSHR